MLDGLKTMTTEFMGNGGALIAESLGAMVVGYILGTVLPPESVSKALIKLLVGLPLPVSIKVKLLRFVDLVVGRLAKEIPDNEDAIVAKYFPASVSKKKALPSSPEK